MLTKLFSYGRVRPADPGATGPQSGLYFLGMPKAGIQVTENNALALSAVYACVSVISKSLAALPFRVYESDGAARRLLTDNPVDRLIHRAPNEEISANLFWRTLLGHVLTWGNGYAEIERATNGTPHALWVLTPDKVEPKRDPNGYLYYEARQSSGATLQISPRNMLHLRGLGFDGVRGYSPVEMARESIATGLAGEQFAGTFYGNGAFPGMVITSDGTTTITPDGITKLLNKFRRRHQGPGNSHKVEFLDPGMKAEAITVPPEQAQFLESRKFQVEEIARWYGVPLHKIGHLDRATNNNIEEQGIDFTVDTLQPWGDVLVQEVNAKLLTGDQYAKINYKARMQTDIKARGQFYKDMFNVGAYSPNDILRLEDENPVPGGDTRFVQVNMMPLNEAAQLTAAGRNGATADSFYPALYDACARLERKENKAMDTAARRGDRPDKIAEFYRQHAVQLVQAIAPVLRVMGRVLNLDYDTLAVNAADCVQRAVDQAMRSGACIESAWLADEILEKACTTN